MSATTPNNSARRSAISTRSISSVLPSFPDNLLATATHDHKRGEDTRARLAVLSERAIGTPSRSNCGAPSPARCAVDDQVPSAGDELILYQALLGSWPLDLHDGDQAGFADYAKRIWQWQQKALREAKLQSSWSAPNEAYENAAQALHSNDLLTGEDGELLRAALAKTVNSIAAAGALNGLAQTLLRMTVPGVPDLYQGNEFWDFSLVDPDNRRPVDYAAREQALQAPLPTCGTAGATGVTGASSKP